MEWVKPPSCKRRGPVTAQSVFLQGSVAFLDSNRIQDLAKLGLEPDSPVGGELGEAAGPQRPHILSVPEARLLSEALRGSPPMSPVLGSGGPCFPSNTWLTPSDKHLLKTGVSKRET